MMRGTRTAIRGALAAALAGVVAVALSGCFMIPLAERPTAGAGVSSPSRGATTARAPASCAST
ncbi:MAG: hypothetical protein K0R81_2749 [Microbacterium sp.]|nr:hypothetical protein [Microbacterium sp.]